MWICVDLALIRVANRRLLLPWRGREADLWREDSNVLWCYLSLEESSAKNRDLLSMKLNSVGLNPTYLLRWYLVCSDLSFFCRLCRPGGPSEGTSACKQSHPECGIHGYTLDFFTLLFIAFFNEDFNSEILKRKKKKTGLCLGFSFVICTVTGLVEQQHHWVPSPALHSLLWTSRS